MSARERVLHVGQGEFRVADDAHTVITTVLGSCVAACLWDADRGVGGMNHILLPGRGMDQGAGASFAVNAMELLVNALLREGAERRRLTAKLFGGARMIEGLGDIGRRNAEVTSEFLAKEGIPCVSTSLGGTRGRRIQFWPATGRARQMLLSDRDVPQEEARTPKPPASELELF